MRRLDREAWIAGALAMLDAQPEQALSIERLARRLQVSRGSFYHHFANRRALVDAARLEFVRRLARSLLPSAADGVIERAARLGFLAFVGLQQTGLDSAQALRDLADDWVCLVSVDAGDRTRGTTPG